jgi:hypothetical protein
MDLVGIYVSGVRKQNRRIVLDMWSSKHQSWSWSSGWGYADRQRFQTKGFCIQMTRLILGFFKAWGS